jgi:hypothetical protein
LKIIKLSFVAINSFHGTLQMRLLGFDLTLEEQEVKVKVSQEVRSHLIRRTDLSLLRQSLSGLEISLQCGVLRRRSEVRGGEVMGREEFTSFLS